MDFITTIANNIDNFIWGLPMIIILIGTHIYMTVRTKGVQRKIFTGIKLSVTKDPDGDGEISPFQALTTALASTIGTGNIIGVGTAIALGGAGAVLWCWLTGVFGIATKYAESLIALKYRVKTTDAKTLGGAMYVIERALKPKIGGKKRSMKWLAVAFALFAVVASFGIGCGVQANAISNVLDNAFNPNLTLELGFMGSDKSGGAAFEGYGKIYENGKWQDFDGADGKVYFKNSQGLNSPRIYYTADGKWMGAAMNEAEDAPDVFFAEIPTDAGNIRFEEKGISLVALIAGIITALCIGLVIFGGIGAISRVCELLVPFMAVMYAIGCIIILFFNRDVLLETLRVIVTSAFSFKSFGGGIMGSGIMLAARYGVARGLFSNESGMGSAPIVASAAQSRNAVRQALISATGTFWDTVVVCLMTGLVIVSSCLKNPNISAETIEGGRLTSAAFEQIPIIGTPILVVGIVLFAFSTILGWSYYGESCIEYMFGKKGIIPYRLIFVLILVIAPITALDLVWTLSNIFNALMSLPNIIAIFALAPLITRETSYYLYGRRLDEYDHTPIPVVDK